MSITLTEMADLLASRWDPDEVCEILQITTEELLDRFGHRLEEDYDRIADILSEEDHY